MPVLLLGRTLLEPARMTDAPMDPPPPETPEDTAMIHDPDDRAELPKENLIHFNPWCDFNDAAPMEDVFGDEPDPEQIAQFMDVVFGYCDGLIPVRSFIDKGQGIDGRPHNIWIEASGAVAEKMATFANWASREGAAVYVIPGTVAAAGQAKAAEVLQMQAVVVDIDTGDIAAKRAHLERHLGPPTMVVESGGATPEGQRKAHAWWKLTEPAEGSDIALVTRLRGEIAAKVGGDMHFRSAHQPIRVAGSVYYKNSLKTQVQIVELNAALERDLGELIEAVADMPPAPGVNLAPDFTAPDKPRVDEVLVTPVREGGQDDWSRFEGASVHFWTVRCVRCPESLLRLNARAVEEGANVVACLLCHTDEDEALGADMRAECPNLIHVSVSYAEKEELKARLGFSQVPYACRVVGGQCENS